MRAVGAIGILLLAGCGSPGRVQVDECERYLVNELRSPSSYKLIKATVMDSEALPASEFADRNALSKVPPSPLVHERTVILEYDAQNAFGATVRGSQMCIFAVTPDQRDAEHSKPTLISRAIEAETEASVGPRTPVAPDCCVY